MSLNSTPSSFIPKRGSNRAKRKKPARRIFVFALVAYSLIFASLLASGASYLYLNYTTSLLQEEVSTLNSEINTFSISDLSVVSEFDLTLKRANERFDNTASVATLLDAIDSATAQPVQIESLEMERIDDQYMLLTAEVITQSFDSALFQRGLLNDEARLFTDVVFEDVSIAVSEEDEDSETTATSNEDQVTFNVTARVPIDSLSYESFRPDTLSIPVGTDNQTSL
jgi:hypothetical protein